MYLSNNFLNQYNTIIIKRINLIPVYVVGSSFLLLASGSVQADLGGRAGQTQLQSNTGFAVQAVCRALSPEQENLAGDQQDLFDRCREMVQNANQLDETGPSANSLGQDEQNLNSALQQVTTEEISTARTMATEVTSGGMSAIITRLATVRRGLRGFQVSGFAPQDVEEKFFANASQLGRTPFLLGGGGGAGDDNPIWSKLGVFVNGRYSTGDKDQTDREDGFDFDTWGFTLGADYLLTDNLVLGGAVIYNNIDTNFDNKPTVAGGSVDADGWGGVLYGTYYGNSYYIDGLLGYARTDYDIKRRIVYSAGPNAQGTAAQTGGQNRTAKADSDSNDFGASIGGGYSFDRGALTFGPIGRINYLRVDIDSYTEKGAGGLNLEVKSQNVESLTSELGGQASYAISRGFGVLVPQIRATWVHEYADDSKTIRATYVNDPNNFQLLAKTDQPDRDYGLILVGLSGVFKGGIQAFFSYETSVGLDDINQHLFTLGGRFEF